MPGLDLNEAMRGKHWLPKLRCPGVTFPSYHLIVPQKRMGVGGPHSPRFQRWGHEHRDSVAGSRVDATCGQRSGHHSGPTRSCVGADISVVSNSLPPHGL